MTKLNKFTCKICGKEAPHYSSVDRANGNQTDKEFYCDECIEDVCKPEGEK